MASAAARPLSRCQWRHWWRQQWHFLFRSVTNTINCQRPEVAPAPHSACGIHLLKKANRYQHHHLKIILVKSRQFSASGSASFPSTTIVRYLPSQFPSFIGDMEHDWELPQSTAKKIIWKIPTPDSWKITPSDPNYQNTRSREHHSPNPKHTYESEIHGLPHFHLHLSRMTLSPPLRQNRNRQARPTRRTRRTRSATSQKRSIIEHFREVEKASRGKPSRSIRLYIKECNSSFPHNNPIYAAILFGEEKYFLGNKTKSDPPPDG